MAKTKEVEVLVRPSDALQPEDQKTSMVTGIVGGRSYPMVNAWDCAICQHEHRFKIEQRLLGLPSRASVVREFSGVTVTEPDGTEIVLSTFTTGAVKKHIDRGHTPYPVQVYQQLAEERAAELGKDYEELVSGHYDYKLAMRVMQARGKERLDEREIDVEMKDVIALTRIEAAMEIAEKKIVAISTDGQSDSYNMAMQVYFDAARAVMTDKQWREFADLLAVNPILRSMAQQDSPNNGVVDAELVDEDDK